jgi:predicted lipoprotein
MLIILKNIPTKTRKQDIANFIMPVVKGGWLRKGGQIKNISILAQKNMRTRIIQYHGLVDILPDEVAEKVIKKLHRKALIGKHIAVCEYRIRNVRNDRRFNQANVPENIKNKRACDCRDHYEPIDSLVISDQFFYGKGW